jgi:hypothetical protein
MKSLINPICFNVVSRIEQLYYSQVGFRFWLRTREDIWWRVNDQIRDQVFNNIKSL